jgi:phosphoenolpyruvate carboxykinase (ATP)
MVENDQVTKTISLENYGIKNAKVHYQLTSEQLHAEAIQKGMGKETNNGTLAINTGKFTGRSPQDRFLVKDDYTADKVWWGDINKPVSPENFDRLQNNIVEYLSGKELYARDGYVCADPKYKMNVRTITEYPWSNMFVYNMFLRPNASELENFEEEWLVLCAPGYECPDPEAYGIRQGNFSILNFTKKVALVGGSAYTGEMKKGIFSALNMILPTDKNV